jgi:F-type H+-transporting ATPase subunit alpha
VNTPLQQAADGAFAAWEQVLDNRVPQLKSRAIGTVTYVGGGVVNVRGLAGIRAESLVAFAGGALGMAFDLQPDGIGIALLQDSTELTTGTRAQATERLTDTPVGEGLLGRVLDASGRVLDGGGPLRFQERRPVEREAPTILDRAPVTVPLQTGLKAVDALIPIGRGQRELLVGDRQTGKTTIAVDTILNQRDQNVICIYCAIGQRGTAVARVVDTLREHHALEYCVVMVATGDDLPGLQFITPYAATTVAEYFMSQGRDVLIVYDDLTRHARAYRELSLLLRRPPGREAYPGDIFYIHARLLERATHLRKEHGGGSLTALPIVETQAQNISAYIPTNLISITDGQIFLSPDLFRKGVMPAIDIGKSVSRVGGKTQLPVYRAVAGDLKLAYAQFEEMETFSRFATRLDEETRETIERGRRVRAILKQAEHTPLSVADQVAVLEAINQGLLDEVPVANIAQAETALRRAIHAQVPALCNSITAGEILNAAQRKQWRDTLRQAIAGQRSGES